MAELAFPLATRLIEKLGSIVSEEISLAWGVKADLQKLGNTMSIIKDVLLDAEQKQAHNQQLRSWLRQLKHVFLDAEDLLDEFECEALRRQVVETFHPTTGKVRGFFSRSNPIAFRSRIGHEITRIDTEMSDKLTLDQLQGRLRHALKDNKFLLVLDDVWNEDRSKWSELRDLLIEGAKSGSKILVTTRNTSVAEMMGTIPTNINLEFLSFEDCLSLFVECAFKEGLDKDYPNLFEMGKDIVRKCGGVPLAVKTLGSQLFSKTDEREWKLVRDSEIWELKQEYAGDILPALRLSYTRLPPHLRQCLAYCSHFRKDRIRFNSNALIRYWMAHGILDQSRVHGNMELEDIGELYFKDLWARSFFQNVIDYHMLYIFDMHDLILDLVQSVAQGECFTVKSANTKGISENVRHLTFLEAGQNVSTTLQKLNKVRTIAAVDIEIDESFLCTCFSRFKYLRVVELSRCSLQVLPSSIGSLKHLRNLDLSFNEAITKLPNAICRLQSLQTLYLGDCENLEELPRDISKLISLTSLLLTTKQTSFTENGVGCLKSLRLLYIVRCSNLTSLPRETSYLASLRTLVLYSCEQLDLGNVNYQGTPL